MTSMRKYPVGIQSFESIRMDGYVYVDKTPLIYKMISEGKTYFLSRPRRFGKSLLCSTLEAVFQGRRELFEAFTTEDGIKQPQLFIANTNWKWQPYPILRFDFSKTRDYSLEALDRQIDNTLSEYEEQYGLKPATTDSSIRFEKIIKEAHRQTGRRVVVIVDEYDTFMLHSIGNRELEDGVRLRFSNVFSLLKPLDDYLQFAFITGISKFSQMGIFSSLNQLNNISMLMNYETLCGISEEELTTQMLPDIKLLAEKRGETYDETLTELKRMYDGYHFSRGLTDVYNPFSLVNAFKSGEINEYWFDSATPSAVIDMLSKMPPIELTDIDGVNCPPSAFDVPFDNYKSPLPVLYQSGYLTIKDYNSKRNKFVLGLPNAEVRRGFAECLYQHAIPADGIDRVESVFQDAFYDFCETDDLQAFIEAIKVFFASIPYHLENRNEHYYHALLYTLLTAIGADVKAEEPSAKGRADMILRTSSCIYVIEIKYDATAAEALEQIDKKGYTDKYRLEGCKITKVGIAFSSQERNITEWLSEDI